MTIEITPTFPTDIPTFDGQPIFGANASFELEQIPIGPTGGAAAVDAFLGLTPGTTRYGPDPSGGSLWGIVGALVGPSSGAVATLEATLRSFAGIVAPFGRPTGDKFPSDFIHTPSCYFVAAEFVPAGAGIVALGGGTWSLSYKLVIRETPTR